MKTKRNTIDTIIVAALLAVLLLGCSAGEQGAAGGAALLSESRQAYETGEYLRSQELYERYLKAEPHGRYRWEAWNRMISVARNVTGDTARAADLMEAAILEFSGDRERTSALLAGLAELRETRLEWDKAASAWQRLLENPDPGDAPWTIQLRLARARRTGGKYDQALEALELCRQAAPDPASATRCRYETAQTLAMSKQPSRAVAVLEELLADQALPDDLRPMAVFTLADLYETSHDNATARRLYQSIQATYPNTEAVRARLDRLRE